jgi:hypothetical protein
VIKLKHLVRKATSVLAISVALSGVAFAQTTTLDQVVVPIPGTGNTSSQSETLIQSLTVPGGALYWNLFRQPGGNGQILPGSMTFVSGGSGSALNRYQNLTDGHSDLGVPLTATAGTPSGTVGVSRTAGTSLYLAGETTSSNAKTDKVIFELNLGSTYIPAANIPVIVNCNYTGGGTVTGASTTMTVAAYTETNGVEAALTVSAAQQFTGTAANYTFTITGASSGLVVGSHIVVELTMLVTSSSGSNTGQINSVALNY